MPDPQVVVVVMNFVVGVVPARLLLKSCLGNVALMLFFVEWNNNLNMMSAHCTNII